MGEIADDILDGIFCQCCGAYIDDEESANGGSGYPRECIACNSEQYYVKS